MANRQFQQFSFTMEKFTVKLYAKVSIGSSGAPTLVSNQHKGIASIVHNSAGDYTITLQDNYYRLLNVTCAVQNASGVPVAPNMGIKVDSVSSGSLEVVFSAAGTPTDPASGDSLFIEISLSNSSAI